MCRGEGRADPDQQPRRSRGRSGSEVGGSRKPGAEGSSPSGRGIQRSAEYQSGGGSSQFDRRREGWPRRLIPNNTNISKPPTEPFPLARSMAEWGKRARSPEAALATASGRERPL